MGCGASSGASLQQGEQQGQQQGQQLFAPVGVSQAAPVATTAVPVAYAGAQPAPYAQPTPYAQPVLYAPQPAPAGLPPPPQPLTMGQLPAFQMVDASRVERWLSEAAADVLGSPTRELVLEGDGGGFGLRLLIDALGGVFGAERAVVGAERTYLGRMVAVEGKPLSAAAALTVRETRANGLVLTHEIKLALGPDGEEDPVGLLAPL
eukprot:SAG11_NODE_1542_length_4717_cov_2.974881_2_plen_206_part_00